MRVRDKLKAYANVSRLEYTPAEAPAMLIPFLLGADSVYDMIGFQIFEAFIVFILLFFSGFIINAVTDIEVDKKYKSYVSSSVETIGVKNLKKIIYIQVTAALLLTLHICYIFNNYWLFLWVLAGTFFGLAYSVKPFHFKVRGVLHATLAFSAGLAPLFFLYYVIAGVPPASIFMILLFLIILHYGIALVNQTQDFLEDKKTGLLTPAVRLGVTKTLTAALVISVFGLSLGFIGFFILFNSLSNVVLFDIVLSFELVYFLTALLLSISYYIPLKGIIDLIKISNDSNNSVEDIMLNIKNRLNYPRWQMSGILGLTIISALFFVLKNF